MYDNKGEVDLDKLGANTQREMAKKFQVFKKNSLDPAKEHYSKPVPGIGRSVSVFSKQKTIQPGA